MSGPLSKFFIAKKGAKRPPSSVIDLTADSDGEEPPAKIHKASTSSFFGGTPRRTPIPSSSSTEQFRFIPGSSQPASRPRTTAQTRLGELEALKRNLLAKGITRQASYDSALVEKVQDPSDDGSSEDQVPFPGTGKAKTSAKVKELGPSGKSFTPLESQVRQIVKDNPGTLLLFEVGYKYIFYGEDAKVAAKLLGMACFLKRNFYTASIPTHRCGIHLKKLLDEGHRVGIVQQTETAALKKVSESKSKLFERKMTKLYTAATFVDDMDSVDIQDQYSPPMLMCIMEEPLGERVRIGIVGICASTGEVTWDEFEDSHMRSDLETRLAHLRPAELFLPAKGLTSPTEKLIQHHTNALGGEKIRTETFKTRMSYSDAFAFVSEFYKEQTTQDASDSVGKLVAAVADFPKLVVVVLAHLVNHLSTFDINLLDITGFTRFATSSHMLLNANTLKNLEVYNNNTDYNVKGSLIWLVDRTKTKFGARLLRQWVGKPLVDARLLKARTDAIQVLIDSSSDQLLTLRGLLKGLPDLSKGIARIQYKQCTLPELAVLLKSFQKIGAAFTSVDLPEDVGLDATLLNQIIYSLPALKEPIDTLIARVSLTKLAEGEKDAIWLDEDENPALLDYQFGIQAVESDLSQELNKMKKLLKMRDLEWSHAAEDYVLNFKKSARVKMPDEWTKASQTTHYERWTSPFIQKKKAELAQLQESLAAEAHKAYLSLLEEIASHYAVLRQAVSQLAIADCLLSLAQVALQENYTRPKFVAESTLDIVNGRHPMVENLRTDLFVPNSVDFTAKALMLSGPNMAGKSSFVRMTGLLCILAQIGSYVPADSMRLSLLDAIHTRMGAEDDILRGRSTFMTEMVECSSILHAATDRSLVILDELGRGTGTWDGMAVAFAAFHHLVTTTGCQTLFITHYPMVCREMERLFPDSVINKHMGYTETKAPDGKRTVTFLYRLTKGITLDSFGVECGRLAGMPEPVLEAASTHSADMRRKVEARIRQNKATKCVSIVRQLLSSKSQSEGTPSTEGLRKLVNTMM